MSFKIYKGDDVVAEGASPLEIKGIGANKSVAKGEYQAVRVEDDKESERVDIPAFKTLPIKVTGVTLAPNNMTGTEGEKSNRQLTATVAPSNATNKKVTYSVAPATDGLTVSTDGVLAWTADVPAGEYTVTVTTEDGKKTDTSKLVLSKPVIKVTGVTIAPKTAELEVGDIQQLSATVAPSNADDKSVSYASKAQGIASVDSKGLVTAKTAGEAEIVVTTTDGSKTDTCVVTVVEPEPEPEPDPDPEEPEE